MYLFSNLHGIIVVECENRLHVMLHGSRKMVVIGAYGLNSLIAVNALCFSVQPSVLLILSLENIHK